MADKYCMSAGGHEWILWLACLSTGILAQTMMGQVKKYESRLRRTSLVNPCSFSYGSLSPAELFGLPVADVGRSADLLSHEATFTADMYAKARVAQHSTAPMAGNFARQLGAQTLVLTHFSGRFAEFRGRVSTSRHF